MKNYFVLIALVLFATPVAAQVYVIENSKGVKPIVIEKDDPALADVGDIGGIPCEGFSYATKYVTSGTAIRVHRGHVNPAGKIATHSGPNVYILYVVSGTGKLVNVGPDRNMASQIDYKADDVIVFRENTLHYWENGSEPFDFVGFEQIPVKN